MALYTQRRRRTRNQSAWLGGPGGGAPLNLEASAGLATFVGGTATLTITPPTATNGLATFGGGTAAITTAYTVTAGAATFAGGVASVSVSVTLTATGALATFGGGTVSYTETHASLLPGLKIRAAPGLQLGPSHRGYRRRGLRRRWTGTSSTPPTDITASDGLVTLTGGTASLEAALAATGALATFTGGTANLAASLAAAAGAATFSGDTATYFEGAPDTSIVPARTGMRAAPGLTNTPSTTRKRRSLRRTWIGTQVPAAPVDLTAAGGAATFTGPAVSVELTLAEASGLATFAGGTADVSIPGVLNLTAADGIATFAGGIATPALTITASSGISTFGGGTVVYTASAGFLVTDGVATFAGGIATTVTVLQASSGTVTFTGATAVFGIVTFGPIDGSLSILAGIDDSSTVSGMIDGDTILAGAG